MNLINDLELDVRGIPEIDLLRDLEFTIRQHVIHKKKETADRVTNALARLDAKRKKRNA